MPFIRYVYITIKSIFYAIFKHVKIVLFRFLEILLKPDGEQNFGAELSQNLARTWQNLADPEVLLELS